MMRIHTERSGRPETVKKEWGTCEPAMVTAAPVMKPEMTACDKKLVSQPRRRRPTPV